ncbi:MAG TPA: T9SS type A sorting domain-containing protein, partial [Ignavibacteria bacterium]|nr:T9SS type A sorting domain-containing protein [Ignavibacteria bacterium]
ILESVDRGIPYRALLLKTTDGGRTWSVPENFTSGAYAYTGLNFKNLKSGYVTTQFFYNKGFIGGIMKTDDGGQSWDTLYIKDNISCYGINILENGTIFVESYNHTENKSIILKSINEGQTWEETIFVNERLTSGDFIDNNTGIYVGYNHNYKTTDGGDNWTELKDSILNNKSFVDFKLLKGTETGILLGINTQNFIPVILKTTNIGISWNETVISPTPTDLDMAFSVGFQSTDNWFASGGYEGAVIYNTDNGGTVSISENNITVPKDFSLNQNYPNPFNPTTMISFTIPQESFVSIKIYNSLGQEVTKLVNETKQAGNYDYNFDASSLSSGMYFYKIEAGDFKKVKSMVLLR